MDNTYFELPGIKDKIDNFKTLLKKSKHNHILIRGPKGVGKGLFLQIFKESCRPVLPIAKTCIAILPGQLPAIIEQAFLKGTPLILEDLEYLAEEDMRSLFGALQSTRVIATSKDTSDKFPAYLLEEFQVFVDVPPLHQRRMDIFHFIALKYPHLLLYPSELLAIFSYHWPSNLRELDNVLFNLQGDNGLENDDFWSIWKEIRSTLNDAWLSDDILELINNELFGGIIPFKFGSQLLAISHSPYCYVSVDDTGSTKINCINEEKKTSTTIDCINIKIFLSDVFGRTALSRDIPIFHNDIFQEHTGFGEVPPISEFDAYYCSDTPASKIVPLSESEQARSDLLWAFTLACNKAHESLAEVRLHNKDLSEDIPQSISKSPTQDPSEDDDELSRGNKDIENESGMSFNTFKKYLDLFNDRNKLAGLAEITIEREKEKLYRNIIKKADIRRVVNFKKNY